MAWVNIKNGRYYRRSRRVNGRVVNEHIGGGEFGEMMAGLDRIERSGRRIEAGFAQAHRDVYGYAVRDVFSIDEFLGNFFTVLARQSGYHLHHRQLRRNWRTSTMSSIGNLKKLGEKIGKQLDQSKRAPLMDANFDGLPEADRVTLQAAAKGDTAALAKAQPYLTDPKYIMAWGNPVYAAPAVGSLPKWPATMSSLRGQHTLASKCSRTNWVSRTQVCSRSWQSPESFTTGSPLPRLRRNVARQHSKAANGRTPRRVCRRPSDGSCRRLRLSRSSANAASQH